MTHVEYFHVNDRKNAVYLRCTSHTKSPKFQNLFREKNFVLANFVNFFDLTIFSYCRFSGNTSEHKRSRTQSNLQTNTNTCSVSIYNNVHQLYKVFFIFDSFLVIYPIKKRSNIWSNLRSSSLRWSSFRSSYSIIEVKILKSVTQFDYFLNWDF